MFKNYKEIDLDWLKNNHKLIHFFGLGFIQVKINETYRLHFYSNELPPFVEDPHNHRYDFESLILKGSFRNIIYNTIEGNNFYIMEDSCQSGFVSPNPPKLGDFKVISDKTYSQGDLYKMKSNVMHTVEGKDCITLLKRGPYTKELALISHKVKDEKKCPFSQKINEEELWIIVGNMLKN